MGASLYKAAITGVPNDFVVREDRGSFYVDELVAVSDDQRYLVGVRLIIEPPFWRDGAEFREFGFGISLFDEERYSTDMIFCPVTAKRYLPDEVRPLVMPIVCSALPVLIDHVQPELIFRRTASVNPDEKALHKHHMITDTLLGIGYQLIQQDTDDDGCVIWVLERGTEVENGES